MQALRKSRDEVSPTPTPRLTTAGKRPAVAKPINTPHPVPEPPEAGPSTAKRSRFGTTGSQPSSPSEPLKKRARRPPPPQSEEDDQSSSPNPPTTDKGDNGSDPDNNNDDPDMPKGPQDETVGELNSS